jgi:hypothetical protein
MRGDDDMSNIRVDVGYTIHDGTEIKFRSPVDCSAITGMIVYYPGANGNVVSKVFALADAHGNNVGDIDHLFAEDVVVKVILDVTKGMAFVQNADTNAYLEAQLAGKVPANYSTASAANGWHRAHFAKIGKMVTCSLIPVANRSEVLYGTSTTIPGGFAPAENISFKLYSNFNASHSGSGTVTLAVNKDGTITVSAANGVSLDELSGTYCWLTA